MNKTEQKALIWLKTQGHNNITFSSTKSPDFITGTGLAFEVKKIREGVIWFGHKQAERLATLENTVILVFNDGDEPIAQIPIADLEGRPSRWRNIRIGYQDRPQDRALTVWPDPTLWLHFRSVALKQGKRANTEALDEAVSLYIEKYNHTRRE